MTANEAYDKACSLWGDGVAWEVEGRFIVGRWIHMCEAQGPEHLVLQSTSKAVEVLGEGSSWEEAWTRAIEIE